MRIFALLTVLLLSSCSVLERAGENQDLAEITVMIAAAEIINKDPEDVCYRTQKALEIVTDVRTVLDGEILTLIDLDSELRDLLSDHGVSPITASILLDIAAQAVSNYTQSPVLSEEAEIVARDLLDVVEEVALFSGEDC